MDSPVSRLHGQLEAAGIPVVSVRHQNSTFEVQFAPEATAEQMQQAEAIVTVFDSRPRRPRPLADLRQDIAAWIGTDPARLRQAVTLALALAAQSDPGLLRRVLNASIDGDEVDL